MIFVRAERLREAERVIADLRDRVAGAERLRDIYGRRLDAILATGAAVRARADDAETKVVRLTRELREAREACERAHDRLGRIRLASNLDASPGAIVARLDTVKRIAAGVA